MSRTGGGGPAPGTLVVRRGRARGALRLAPVRSPDELLADDDRVWGALRVEGRRVRVELADDPPLLLLLLLLLDEREE